jgi:hypothetical protein
VSRQELRLQLASDLHLERQPEFQLAPCADTLVLAGDVGSYQPGSRLQESDWGLARFARGWQRVFYVPGNHEYDHLPWPDSRARLREAAERHGLIWLDREVRVQGGVRFVGCTLWADFDLLVDPRAPMAQQLKARDKAYRAANFYLRRYSSLENGQPMLAERLRELALQDQAWLRGALAQAFEGPDGGGDAFRAERPQRRSALRRDAGHRGLLQRARRSAGAGRPVAARAPALRAGLPRRQLPGGRQSAGLCGERRAGRLPAAVRPDDLTRRKRWTAL